ncbi:unnamed protein product [Effrenium voratum]|uniref:DNA replication licensing factor MCM6 n=1 Tax=Effrenium voratum TaxID=2562239 RepID=A0AA36JSH1_9DINO|nr:unnamed protein product [Effrenium voratum]CAJ1410349.1 unnamed protein product [Effrenium voratum]CAJ1437664.1 unnamed protein product [Effrenium voratum]
MDPHTRSHLVQRVQRYFLEFLETFRLPGEDGEREGDVYYISQAKAMVKENKKTLYIKMGHLEQADRDAVSFEPQDLIAVITSRYMVVRDALNAALPQLLSKLDDPEVQAEVQKMDELKFTVAFHDLATYSGIRDLRTEKLGRLVTICGTVTRTTDIKPELLVATWKCNECRREITGIAQEFKVTTPTKCPTKHCGNTSNWKLLAESRSTRWGDWQRVRLQENENEVPAGSMPQTMDIIVRDESTERCKAGDKVQITGSLIVVPDVPTLMSPLELKATVRRSLNSRSDPSYAAGEGIRGLKALANRDLTYKLAFYGTHIDEDSDWASRGSEEKSENIRSEEKMYLSPVDKERFEQLAEHVGGGGKRDCLDLLARAVAPSINGYLEVKKGILLMLVGGSKKSTMEGIQLRGDINVCLLGDPATGKSEMLRWVSKFLPRAVFTSGKSSTAAGLTASVVKDADLDNERLIEPGALMLADNGVCCIDEFELMDVKDMVAIHEAMEQQTITLSKAGIQATLNARACILASVLPKNTYYQATLPLHKNCELSPPIMSRFDLFFVLQDIRDETQDQTVAKHIITLHQRKEEAAPTVSQLDLQRYIRLARTYKPKISPEAHALLIKCYKKLREDRSYTRGSAGVTVRQLESLIRLSEAIARVYLSEWVRQEHVKEAFELQISSLRQAERESIDLGTDDVAPSNKRGREEEGEAAPQRHKRVRITHPEYMRMGQMLLRHLAEKDAAGTKMTEGDLITWYMERVEPDLVTEEQLFQQQHLVQLVVSRMIDKDRVILVTQPSKDPLAPESRVLQKHPNVPVDSLDRM